MAVIFLTFDLDEDRRELRSHGKLVSLTPRSFDVLCYLIAHHHRMVTKSELLDQFWSAKVSESALQKTISLLRKATGCDGQSVVRTYHGLGFRFVPDLLIQPTDPQTIPSGPSAALQERRLVSVLCLQFDAEATENGNAIERFLERARKSVWAHQGDASRMTLDGFTVSFGLMSNTEDAARQAVHCAVALIEAAQERDPICVTIGIDHGPVDLSETSANTLWRRPSEIERGAIELADAGVPNGILLSATTQNQLGDEVKCIPVETGFQLAKVNDVQAGVPGRPRKKPAQFVGRGAEMAFLQKSLETTTGGHGQGIVLAGPAGIGKTRLLSEFLQALDPCRYNKVKLQCLPGLSNSPLAPFREMCQMLFSQAPEGTLKTDSDVALHAEFLGKTTQFAAALIPLSDHQRKQQSFALVRRLLAAYCETTPLVLVFEDIHWLDFTSRDCLDAVIEHADGMRLLVVSTTRPSDAPPRSEAMVQLSPLGHNDGLKLLHDNIDATKIDDQVADDLVHRAAGNPFFIEELALALQSGDDPARELPETVQVVISGRIGALDVAARALLYVLAVIGPGARVELVMHLLNQNADAVAATATRLRTMGFVMIEPGTYSFRHMLINDTAYAMLAPPECRRLHRDIVAFLESDAPKWTSPPEILAWHNQQAGQANQATFYWLEACRAASRRLAHREAIVFAQNGLSLMAAGGVDAAKRELDLQLYLATALAAINGYGAVNVGEAYERARRLNETLGEQRANIRVLVGQWIHAWVGGNLSQSLMYAQDLLDVAEIAKDPALSLQAHASMGQVLMHQGQLKNARAHLTVGLKSLANAPPTSIHTQNASVACSAFASWTNCMLGNVAEADRNLAVSFELAHFQENPLGQAIHFGLGQELFMFTGQIERCLDYSSRAVALSRSHDFAFWLGSGLVMQGWALGQQGKMDAAFKALDEGIHVVEATGAGVQLSNWYGLRAETLLAVGRFEEGVVAADHALHCASKTGDIYFTPRIHAITARLWYELGAPAKAAHHAQLASKRAASFGMVKSVITLLI